MNLKDGTVPAAESSGMEKTAVPESTEAAGLENDGWRMDEDGEVAFGEEFFNGTDEEEGSAPGEPDEGAGARGEGEVPKQGHGVAGEAPPAFYTPEEFASVPLDQIDANRLPEEARQYLPIVMAQLQGMKQQHIFAMQNQAVNNMQTKAEPEKPPKLLERKEIAKLAVKEACKQLGISEDEFDCYDAENVTVLNLEAQKIASENRAEVERYQAQEKAAEEFGRFSYEMVSCKDFADFDRWVTGRMVKAGLPVSALTDYANSTGDWPGVQRTIQEMYQLYQQDRIKPKPAAETPPVVESTKNAAGVKKQYDLKKFGDMDDDEQAGALMEMGLV